MVLVLGLLAEGKKGAEWHRDLCIINEGTQAGVLLDATGTRILPRRKLINIHTFAWLGSALIALPQLLTHFARYECTGQK